MELKRWLQRKSTVEPLPHVLLVDDEKDVRMVVRGLLELEGFDRISEAEDGEGAIEIINKDHPEILVLDYMMPRMDGQAVARCARLLSPPSRIIIFTGFLPSRPDWTDSCDGYIEKTDIDGLLTVLWHQVLGLKSQLLFGPLKKVRE